MTAQLDFLRLATYQQNAYTETIARLMDGWPGEWKDAKWLQYKGWKKETLFLGHARQDDKEHTLMSISGAMAQEALPGMRERKEWYATRVDIQVTIENPKTTEHNLRVIRDSIAQENTTLYESALNDTLYVGSRTSEFYLRLYEKPLDTDYLRLEFELKGTRAKQAWRALQSGEKPGAIFRYYLDKSKLPNNVKSWYQAGLPDATEHSMNAQRLADQKKKLAWLTSLDATVLAMMANHDIGQDTRRIIDFWAKESARLDKT